MFAFLVFNRLTYQKVLNPALLKHSVLTPVTMLLMKKQSMLSCLLVLLGVVNRLVGYHCMLKHCCETVKWKMQPNRTPIHLLIHIHLNNRYWFKNSIRCTLIIQTKNYIRATRDLKIYSKAECFNGQITIFILI